MSRVLINAAWIAANPRGNLTSLAHLKIHQFQTDWNTLQPYAHYVQAVAEQVGKPEGEIIILSLIPFLYGGLPDTFPYLELEEIAFP